MYSIWLWARLNARACRLLRKLVVRIVFIPLIKTAAIIPKMNRPISTSISETPFSLLNNDGLIIILSTSTKLSVDAVHR